MLSVLVEPVILLAPLDLWSSIRLSMRRVVEALLRDRGGNQTAG